MPVDIQSEVLKASGIMARYRMHQDDQRDVIRILMGAGIEHCLVEQERLKDEVNERVDKAFVGPGITH